MEGKKISVIVPIYRTEEYLARCVESLINQTYEALEIILVDDGSPDGCPALCDRYAEKDGRIRVIHKENGGLVSAWQAGVKESTGNYLCFVDSDDWVEKDMLEHMASVCSGEAAAGEIICCNFVINRPGKETAHYHGLAPGDYQGEKLQGEIKDNLLGHENRKISMSRCMKLFSRELIEENMKYSNPRITMAEDVNIVLPALLDSRRVVILEGALYYHYFYNDASIVHRYDAGLYEGIRILMDTIREIYRQKGRGSGAQQADREYLYFLLMALKNEVRSGESGYVDRVKRICREEENRELIASREISCVDKANRLLYLLLRHPSGMLARAIRLAFVVYDGLRR